jgi:hypothetical protein
MSRRAIDWEGPTGNATRARKVRPGQMPVAAGVTRATIQPPGDPVYIAGTGRRGDRHSLEDQGPCQQARDQYTGDSLRPERELVHFPYGTPRCAAESSSRNRRTGESPFPVADSQHGSNCGPSVVLSRRVEAESSRAFRHWIHPGNRKVATRSERSASLWSVSA